MSLIKNKKSTQLSKQKKDESNGDGKPLVAPPPTPGLPGHKVPEGDYTVTVTKQAIVELDMYLADKPHHIVMNIVNWINQFPKIPVKKKN